MWCKVCGNVDEQYDESSEVFHDDTPKHICNKILQNYKANKRLFSKNRDGVFIFCTAETLPLDSAETEKTDKLDIHKIRIYAKPMQSVKFTFSIKNDMKNEDLVIVGIQLAHPQPQFQMNDHPFIFGQEPHILEKKSSLNADVHILFKGTDIGQYEMPIMFTFFRSSVSKNLIFIREMVVLVQEEINPDMPQKSPYANEDFARADHFVPSLIHNSYNNTFKIPKLFKILLPLGLDESALESLKFSRDTMEQLRLVLLSIRTMFDEGITKLNYITYFHHLLYWEEIIARINLKRYNMTAVPLQFCNEYYQLEVPGLSENRPSLLRGDRVLIQQHGCKDAIFETVIRDIDENIVHLGFVDYTFSQCFYNPCGLYDIRFLSSRIPMERAHEAVSRIMTSKQECRIFPKPIKPIPIKRITKFYNRLIENNEEQRSAVEHIITGSSGRAPYMVYGPPGTGKTMTIVEAIIQLVVANPKNQVMVCTDSNMAADHIALMLYRYNKELNIDNFIIRANSQNRNWSVMPVELGPISNGKSYETFYSLSNSHMVCYRIVVTTLLHAAKYGSARSQTECKLQMSHLFIDEAGQASEPNALVPVTGLLRPTGQLVLAGDPQQLGPVCISHDARERGLGRSLMERLKETYDNLYNANSNYITMLVKNFRSHPDILRIPNELFYDNCLQPKAPLDSLSNVSILGVPGGESAVVFHSVNSREQKMGKSPSYFNEKELEMLQRYVLALLNQHKVSPKDIGVIAPYIRQVYKMKLWLTSRNYNDIEVGTVEAFQGKEKRVILVSTVRANCRLLDYDAKYGLGFLVDDKRFNVTLTRAKSKLIIIGNPVCLTRDLKWRKYMSLCEELDSYFGKETEQIQRNADLLIDISKTRFQRCRLTEELKSMEVKKNKKK